MDGIDPITAIANAAGQVAILVTKAMPSDEERLKRLNARLPLLNQRFKIAVGRKRLRLVKKAVRECMRAGNAPATIAALLNEDAIFVAAVTERLEHWKKNRKRK